MQRRGEQQHPHVVSRRRLEKKGGGGRTARPPKATLPAHPWPLSPLTTAPKLLSPPSLLVPSFLFISIYQFLPSRSRPATSCPRRTSLAWLQSGAITRGGRGALYAIRRRVALQGYGCLAAPSAIGAWRRKAVPGAGVVCVGGMGLGPW